MVLAAILHAIVQADPKARMPLDAATTLRLLQAEQGGSADVAPKAIHARAVRHPITVADAHQRTGISDRTLRKWGADWIEMVAPPVAVVRKGKSERSPILFDRDELSAYVTALGGKKAAEGPEPAARQAEEKPAGPILPPDLDERIQRKLGGGK